jgi:putative ABC transport system permease protein
VSGPVEWGNAARIGLKGLTVHKFRAALSMLGIIFGVASVVAVIAVSEGAHKEVLKQLAALGANNIMVDSVDWRLGTEQRDMKKRARLRSEGLTVREAATLAERCPLISNYAPLRKVDASVRFNEVQVTMEVIGTTPSYINVMQFPLREGRWLVCVIEDAVRQNLFAQTSPLGGVLVIDHEPYEIVGVLQSKEVASNAKDKVDFDINQLNRRVYIPLAAALARTTQPPLSDEASQVVFSSRSPEDLRGAAAFIQRYYEHAHNMEGVPLGERDYQVKIAADLVKQSEDSQRIFNYVMMSSASISLIVGGIGIMNIMLANVTERRREIGIRRAVGATQGDILRQFLFESLSICLLGGLAGCVVGVIFSYIVHQQTGWQVALAWWSMVVALGVSLLDGVAFGTYPAWKAGCLDPIEALRYE